MESNLTTAIESFGIASPDAFGHYRSFTNVGYRVCRPMIVTEGSPPFLVFPERFDHG